jgi:hypothetical protein
MKGRVSKLREKRNYDLNFCSAFCNNLCSKTRNAFIVNSEYSDRRSIPGKDKGFFFSSPQHPDLLWALPASCQMGTGSFFSGDKRGLGVGVNLTTHLHIVPRSKMVELYLHSAIRLHEVVLN